MNDYTSLGTQPISEAQPCGADVRDEPEFESLQDEIAKMSNPAASGTPDWEQVLRLASTLLASKGKDVLVACYLAGGLLVARGLPGLSDGTQMLAGLLDTWWEQLHPPLSRLRARRNAVQWLIDRVRAHADEHDWSSWPPQDPQQVESLRAALDAIDRVLAEKDSDAPSMQPLRALVATVPVAEPAPPPEPAAAEAPAAPVESAAATPAGAPRDERPAAPVPAAYASAPSAAAPAFAGTALAPVTLDSPESADRAASEALERVADIGAWYAEADPSNVAGFRLRRIGVWAGIERAPAGAGTDTALPGPIPPLQDALHALQSRAAHADLVSFAETQLLQYPFWLDLNCVAAAALAQLGDAWSAARREVCNETGKFVDRLTGITQLKFANGVPFANADTVQWLQSLAAPGGGEGTAAATPDPLAAVLSRARALAAEGDLGDAAQCLQDAIERNANVIARLRLRTALCDLLLEHRPGARLDSFARAVVAEIDRYDVAAWDPALAADALRAAYAVLARNDENTAETDVLLERIAPLNAATAVRLII
ncbi:type VI secretion system protein TssA [Paraburkholderia sacchari]|uniref:type VI secretion system protein TssA n=1 Tax=Paraburkholderia sacchari TaxID=159450 RepID=UPI001BCE985D|nr:type VI secretion system protein TssA [Paraburkholderia sacchari]